MDKMYNLKSSELVDSIKKEDFVYLEEYFLKFEHFSQNYFGRKYFYCIHISFYM